MVDDLIDDYGTATRGAVDEMRGTQRRVARQ